MLHRCTYVSREIPPTTETVGSVKVEQFLRFFKFFPTSTAEEKIINYSAIN